MWKVAIQLQLVINFVAIQMLLCEQPCWPIPSVQLKSALHNLMATDQTNTMYQQENNGSTAVKIEQEHFGRQRKRPRRAKKLILAVCVPEK